MTHPAKSKGPDAYRVGMMVSALLLLLCNGCVVDDENTVETEDAGDIINTIDATSLTDTDPVLDAMTGATIDMAMTGREDRGVRPDATPLVDTMIIDMETVDAAPIVDAEPPPPIVPCDLDIQIRSPANLSFHRLSLPAVIEGVILNTASEPVAGLTVQLRDENDSIFATTESDLNGVFSVSAEPLHDTSGLKSINATVLAAGGVCAEFGQTSMYVCRGEVDEDFSDLPEEWTLFRDATWNPGGWLEMTGIETGRGGAVYNSVEVISSGLASIEFTLTTGGGINGGADGFAFTIVEVASSDQLLELLSAANRGGGLGYAVGGSHADPDFTLPGEAVTVEIDTFYNSGGNRHTDPTPQNHIAITQNGDPGDHLAWFPVPNIEDLRPHTVRMDILEEMMRITFDGTVVIEQQVNLAFKGGYMFFSGSTGWATNYHRFDDLRILHSCR